MNFYDRIRALREDSNLSQTEMGKLINMTQRKVSRLETNESTATIEEIEIYCKFFNLSADYILGFTDEPKPLPRK